VADTTPYPLIQGNAFAWSSVEIDILGVPQLGITSINYNSDIDPADVYGAGSNPIAFTQGKVTLTGDFEILLNQYNAMVAQLGPGWRANTIGDIIVKYSEDAAGFDPIVDTLGAVRILQVGATAQSSSSDALVRKLTFKYLKILENGINPMPAQPTSTQ